MHQDALVNLREHIAQGEGADTSPLSEFVLAYFSHADAAELQARGPAFLLAQANAHLRLLDSTRGVSGARIRVFNPSLDEDGFVCEHTLVQIVQDDMQFLVDSVTMAVNKLGHVAHWIVHPLLALTFDAQRQLSSAMEATAQTKDAASIESFISLECDRLVSGAEREALALELDRVLTDVRAAVSDWLPMLKRLQSVREASSGSPLSSRGEQEGSDFLRWLEDQNFTFLGARDYEMRREEGVVRLHALADTSLGVLRGEVQTPVTQLPDKSLDFLDSDQLVMVTKAMTRSTVHRSAWLDCVAVKRFDKQGQVVGESRFLGLYTSKAYAAPVQSIPQIRRHTQFVMNAADVLPDSHAAKSLQVILDNYPRDEMFQIDSTTLAEHAMGILRLQEGQRTRLFLRRDPFGRFVSAQVFVPRDRYNTELRSRIAQELMRTLDGVSFEFTPMLTDNPLARIHYLIRTRELATLNPDVGALEARIALLARRWEDDCKQMLLQHHGESNGLMLAKRFAHAFSPAYQNVFSVMVGAGDALVLSELSPTNTLAVNLYRPLDAAAGMLRLKLYSNAKVALSDSLPVLERLGARVLDEQPYKIHTPAGEGDLWIHDLGLLLPPEVSFSSIQTRFESLFVQVWRMQVESDDLNKLVLVTHLDGRAISVLRAYNRYFKQLGFAFSQSYMEATLYKHAGITQLLMDSFEARFNPTITAGREERVASLSQQIQAHLAEVDSLDEDKILRQFHDAMVATLRTNVWQTTAQGLHKPHLSFKFDPRNLPGVPKPQPLYEIWVYAPRFEGVHLRNGKVARGGLRWSDRREDFRTEILGLAKAQQVKNTVIVPAGSKGGFVLKNPPPSSDRDALMAEGIACYRLFLSGLLDLTDNLVQGQVVPPAQLVRHDADDPYLVVAADKGTATFSDIANSVSAEYGFWLGDAFASGGSVGYDHKKMGITARGAWESTKRHFRNLSIDTQTTSFTVLGIGDMSGDVFGNGMLLSKHIALVLAFDHRHIFIDPTPDVAASFVERQRLFALARSSWGDYDRAVLSPGGGIYPRSAKSIKLSAQARALLGIEATDMAPVELLNAMLKAPVQLIYNGGIGTYVKATLESHAQVGDKSSDAFRINASELRCKVFVEGGNLGATQNGRIEFARRGGLIYNDAIDNSAGVDCSDHEVNIKILLNRVLESGDLTLKQRNELLAAMTDEVGHLVLADNYYQTQALDAANHRPRYLIDGQQRLIQSLESLGRLDRVIEFLPSDEEIASRKAQGAGLTTPEGAVLLAYAKMSLFDEMLTTSMIDDPYLSHYLRSYFPSMMREKFANAIELHPLRREIIATCVTNNMVNRVGSTFVHFLASETAAGTGDVVRAFLLAREVFGLEALWAQIDALDGKVPSALQMDLLAHVNGLAQRATRWVLRAGAKPEALPVLIDRYQSGERELHDQLTDALPEAMQTSWQQATLSLTASAVPEALARRLCAFEYLFPVLQLVDMAKELDKPLLQVASAYWAVDVQLSLSSWRTQVDRLPTDTLWQTQARASARDEVFATAVHITRTVLRQFDDAAAWSIEHASTLTRLRQFLQAIAAQPADLASVMVTLRELRQLTAIAAD